MELVSNEMHHLLWK